MLSIRFRTPRATLGYGVVLISLAAAVPADAQPQLSVNGVTPPASLTVGSGSAAAVTLVGGPASVTDWIGLYAVGAPDGQYLAWQYLNGSTAPPAVGLAGAALAFGLPVAPGSYEFRLFAHDTYERLATSPTVIVAASEAVLVVNGAGPPEPVTVPAGSVATVSVSGGPANRADWVGFYASNSADGAYLDWRYLNGTTGVPATGVSAATLTFAIPATPGGYEFRFFANNTYARLATSSPVVVAPSAAQLTVNGTAPPAAVPIPAGGVATVVVADGPANAADWVGLYAVGASDRQYLTWRYFSGTTTPPSSGLADATLSIAMPTGPGSYEFRLFGDNSYQLLATSSTVVIAPSAAQFVVNGAAAPEPVTVAAGSAATVSVSGGPGNRTDWVGFYPAGTPDSGYLDWRYLNGTTGVPESGVSTASLTFTVPVTAGEYEFRFFVNNTYERLATSGAVTVAAPTAHVAVNGVLPPPAVSLTPESPVTVTVTGAPGNATDWVGLYPAGAPDGGYLTWKFLSGSTAPPAEGLVEAALTFTLPEVEGEYEFRLFANNSYQRLATSTSVAVAAARPVVTIALTSPLPNAVFTGPASILLEASVTVTGGTVARVDFRRGAELIGSVAGSPYATTWTDVPAGTYTLTAVAIDSSGAATASAPVDIVVTDGGMTTGTLGPPVAAPPPGVYRPPLVVVLTAAEGASIRYTVDNSEPTLDSPVYAAPVAIEASTTLLARAFKPGWTPSHVLQQTYTIDPDPPIVTAWVTPAPNALGWNNSPVTIRFTCTDAGAGVAHCPDPIAVTTEGPNQVVTATATDALGNTATTSVTVNLDLTPPSVALGAPVEGATVTSDTIAASGTVADGLSDVIGASCNGVAATINGLEVTCNVPLRPGLNAVVLHVTDRAGNSASFGVNVRASATRPVVSPSRLTMLIGQTRLMTLTDDSGQTVNNVIWSTDDAAIATTSTEDGRTLEAIGPGETTVTATVGGNSALAHVTVVGGTSLPHGTVLWANDPPTGFMSAGVVYTHRVEPDVPDLYAVEYEAWPSLRYRGFTSEGDLVRTDVPPVSENEYIVKTMGDTYGGLVVALQGYVWDGEQWRSRSGLARFGGSAGSRPWRYDSPGQLEPEIAQGPDGTIFLRETDAAYRAVIAVLDGQTGAVKSRITLPTGLNTLLNEDCMPGWNYVSESVPRVGPLSVAADGTAHAEVVTENWFTDYLPCRAGTHIGTSALTLLTVSPNGAWTQRPIHTYTNDRIDLALHQVLPDSEGGMLAPWNENQYVPDVGWTTVLRGAYVRDAGIVEYPLPAPNGQVMLAGESGLGYMWSYSSGMPEHVVAFNLATGAVRWTAPVTDYAVPIAALEGGGAVLRGDSGALQLLDENGTVTDGGTLPVANPQYWDNGVWIGEGSVELLSGPTIAPADFSFQSGSGNRQGQKAPASPPDFGIFAKVQFVGLLPNHNWNVEAYYHVSIRFTPRHPAPWRTVFQARYPDRWQYLSQPRDKNNHWFFTIGAGSEGGGICGGRLVSDLDRTGDIHKPASWLGRLDYEPTREDELIQRLLDLDRAYDDKLPYDCFPDAGTNTYNSNSYAAGLLNAAGIPLPALQRVPRPFFFPGWTKPVPPAQFGRNP